MTQHKNKTGTELAAVLENLPVPAIVEITPESLAEQEAENLNRLDTLKAPNSVLSTLMWTSGVLVGSTMTIIGLPVLAAVGISGFMAFPSFLAQQENATQAQRIRDNSHRQLKEQFVAAQDRAFEDKQRHLLRLADIQLQKGSLLEDAFLPYLALIRPCLLADASDQLAITVLQARAMLAYARCTARTGTGARTTPRPHNFASLGFNPQREDHRHFLREKLEQADNAVSLAEDTLPVYEEIHFEKRPIGTGGIAGFFARTAAAPVFLLYDRYKHRKAVKLPAVLPPVSVPPLLVEPDFLAILAHYEAAEEKLDLPAVRGWPRIVSGPARLLPPPPR